MTYYLSSNCPNAKEYRNVQDLSLGRVSTRETIQGPRHTYAPLALQGGNIVSDMSRAFELRTSGSECCIDEPGNEHSCILTPNQYREEKLASDKEYQALLNINRYFDEEEGGQIT